MDVLVLLAIFTFLILATWPEKKKPQEPPDVAVKKNAKAAPEKSGSKVIAYSCTEKEVEISLISPFKNVGNFAAPTLTKTAPGNFTLVLQTLKPTPLPADQKETHHEMTLCIQRKALAKESVLYILNGDTHAAIGHVPVI